MNGRRGPLNEEDTLTTVRRARSSTSPRSRRDGVLIGLIRVVIQGAWVWGE